MNTEQEYYGVRVDTDKYAYLIRLNPNKGEYNMYCYCYRRDWLDDHIRQARRGIRFITPHYEEKFRIADGVIPLRSDLPDCCYSVNKTTGEIIILKKGETGFYRTDIQTKGREESRELADFQNSRMVRHRYGMSARYTC